NMDSMVNRYTADRRLRSDDAYSPGGTGGARPDRSVIVYAQRAREAFPDVPIVLGGIEASLRRIAHYDYWSEKVRRTVLLDAKADLLVYGNGERQICELAHRLAEGESIRDITDVRGTVFARRGIPSDWIEIDSTHLDAPGPMNAPLDPYAMSAGGPVAAAAPPAPPCGGSGPPPGGERVVRFVRRVKNADRERSVIRMPAFEAVAADPVLYAHASRIDRKSTRLNSSHLVISYAVFCLKKKKSTSRLDTLLTIRSTKGAFISDSPTSTTTRTHLFAHRTFVPRLP